MTAAPGAVTSHLGQMGGAQQSQSGQGNVSDQDLVLVPAGLFSGLLAGLAGNIGGAVGGLFGQGQLGQQIGEGARPFIEMIPFSVIPAGTAR